jgi:hypothetical protein
MRYGKRLVVMGWVLCVAAHAAAAHMVATARVPPDQTSQSIQFMGRRYVLSRSVSKGIGVSTVYIPSGSHHGKNRELLMINYTLSHGRDHSPVTARQIAAKMVNTFHAMHSPWVFPFAIPDRHSPGHFIYVVNSILLMPSLRQTALIMTRVRAAAGGKWIVGIIFQRVSRAHWSGRTKLRAALAPDRRWLQRHLQAVAKALTDVRPPLPSPVLHGGRS